ncbi:hypothetical protein ACP70R_048698 [Stipagrostis hirtigluma subsp. patula]
MTRPCGGPRGRPPMGSKPKCDYMKMGPKVPSSCKLSMMTTLVCWNLAPDVDYYQVRNLFQKISGVVNICFTSTRRCAVVCFATGKAVQMALYHLTGCCLMGRPLKFAWFDDSYDLDRDTTPVMDFLPGFVPHTVYVEGFDSSLSVTQIRSMLRSHFSWGRRHVGQIFIPENPDGTSTGKAFVRFQSNRGLLAALERDGLDLGDGCKLHVTRWLELLSFPWHKKEKDADSGGASGGHADTASWSTPSTGKRIVFKIEI